jgi:hypothetical protein
MPLPALTPLLKRIFLPPWPYPKTHAASRTYTGGKWSSSRLRPCASGYAGTAWRGRCVGLSSSRSLRPVAASQDGWYGRITHSSGLGLLRQRNCLTPPRTYSLLRKSIRQQATLRLRSNSSLSIHSLSGRKSIRGRCRRMTSWKPGEKCKDLGSMLSASIFQRAFNLLQSSLLWRRKKLKPTCH